MAAATPSTSRARALGRSAIAAPLAAALSLAGFLLAGWTTWKKFEVDHLCVSSGCTGDARAGWFSCDEALTSVWSQVFQIPLTVYAAALFTVTLLLALTLWLGRGPLLSAARPLLVLAAVAAAMVSLALGAYAAQHFRHLCVYCTTLYAVCGALLLVVLQPSRHSHTLRQWLTALRNRSQPTVDATLLVVAAFTISLAGQVAAYRLGARQVECPRPVDVPPLPQVRHSFGGAPRTIVMMFVDPSCATCRTEVHLLRQSLAMYLRRRSTQWDDTELWVYPVPFEVCDDQRPTGWFVDDEGRPLSRAESSYQQACLAARAVECAAAQRPELGLEALGELYGLHDTNPPYFTFERIAGALKYMVSADYDMDMLRRCIDRPETTARLSAYQEYFAAWCQKNGLCNVPQAFVVPIEAGRPRMHDAIPADNTQKILHLLALDPGGAP